MKRISRRASLGSDVVIGEGSIIEEDVVIGDNTKIGCYTVIHENVEIGNNTFIGDHVSLGERTSTFYENPKSYANPTLRIGANSIIRTGSVLYAGTEIGSRLQTGSHAVIRENSCLGDGNVIGDFSLIYQNVKMGRCNRLISWVLLAPTTVLHNYVWFFPYAGTISDLHPPCGRCNKGPTIDDYAIIGTGAILYPKIRVGKNAMVAVGSVVTKDVEVNMLVMGVPARSVGDVRSIRCEEGLVEAPYPWRYSISKEKIKRYGYGWRLPSDKQRGGT